MIKTLFKIFKVTAAFCFIAVMAIIQLFIAFILFPFALLFRLIQKINTPVKNKRVETIDGKFRRI